MLISFVFWIAFSSDLRFSSGFTAKISHLDLHYYENNLGQLLPEVLVHSPCSLLSKVRAWYFGQVHLIDRKVRKNLQIKGKEQKWTMLSVVKKNCLFHHWTAIQSCHHHRCCYCHMYHNLCTFAVATAMIACFLVGRLSTIVWSVACISFTLSSVGFLLLWAKFHLSCHLSLFLWDASPHYSWCVRNEAHVP